MSLYTMEGTIKYPTAGISAKVETVETKGDKEYKTIHEVLFFDKAHLEFKAGDKVKIGFELQTKKTEYVRKFTKKDGTEAEAPVYMTQIVARKSEKIGDSEAME